MKAKANYIEGSRKFKRFSNDFEIWVFDNNSSDGSSQTVKDLCNQIDELVLLNKVKIKVMLKICTAR